MAVDTAVSADRAAKTNKFPYQLFMESEGIPIFNAVVGVDDVTKLPRKPWARMGGSGTFIELVGTFESERGIYVAEIPGSGTLEPEKHLYEEEIFVLEGRGIAQVWQGEREKMTFEWGPGSVFAFPPNTTHRLLNGGRDPVVLMGVTTAPRVINALDDLPTVFESNHQLVDLYGSGDNYFLVPEQRGREYTFNLGVLYTNFIPDCRSVVLDDLEHKVAGGQLTGYRMGKRFPRGHISEWPSGRYHKAHYHGPGAILLGLDGDGYVLAWPSRLGARPYRDGHGDQVHRVNWAKNSIYSPPNAYFHQHLNTAAGPAKHIAVYGETLPLGVHNAQGDNEPKAMLKVKDGGTLIDYEDEDPQVRKDFEETLKARGIECQMPPVAYSD